MKLSRSALSCAVAPMLLLAAQATLADPSRLDAGMRRQLEAQQQTPPTQNSRARAVDTAATSMISATVHFTGDGLAQMKALGVAINSVLGDIATVRIPAARLAEVSALPGVIRIETPSKPVARLQASVPATRADLLRTGTNPANWAGGTGKGVIVGVIDTGLDLAHLDFRKPDGTTRVLTFWNQRTDAVGTPPNGADGNPLYGAVCSQAMINLALQGTANNCLVVVFPEQYS